MKVLLVSTFITGGAGGASYQLHKSLQNVGVSSKILVQEKPLDLEDKGVIVEAKSKLVNKCDKFLRWKIEGLPLKLYPKRHILTSNFDLFSPSGFPILSPLYKQLQGFVQI